jgi:outer membrane lipoprotein carrier protein
VRSSSRPSAIDRIRALLHLVATALLAAVLLGNGAPDRAQAVVDELQKRYASVRDMRAEFVQTSYVASLGREEVSRGQVVVKRPARMRWEYREPEPRVIVIDGDTLRIFSPVDRQLQIAPLEGGAFSPTALGFLLGDIDLTRVFDAKLIEGGRADRRGVELRPREDAVFESLRIWLDPETHQVRESVVLDLFGNRTEVRFENAAENVGVEEEIFTIEVPEDTDVVDLRQ